MTVSFQHPSRGLDPCAIDLRCGNDLAQRSLQIVRMKSERSGLALVCDPAGSINQVEPVGPCRVGALGRVAELIQHRRNLDTQLAYTGAGDVGALVFAPRAGEDDLVLDVALHLPNVAGMRLGDVDDQKRDLILILLIQLVEGGHLPPERRSGVAAKHEYHGVVLRGKRRELDLLGLVQFGQREVGRAIAHGQCSRPRMQP